MTFVNYNDADNQTALLAYLRGVEWNAGRFMHRQLTEDTFYATFGQRAKLFFLMDRHHIAGFGALVEQDYQKVADFTPWIAFVYVDPAYRGDGWSRRIVTFLEAQAIQEGWHEVYILTQHQGLYGKMDYHFVYSIESHLHGTDYIYHKALIGSN
ncbi:GNAT family N-acetyltransferase [Peptoniphilus equinus]|uniref:GNAT family N-acetyltransferase n=1 Tax=Peptoniphilus equinus TaxID=3016343 RepID=A0ABY7QUC0_9FIRM|nr:GNAT family N-acetyltransferase [Peptoniphilus equinus]WBW49875.1 GNAT family N-acetyltransferase [Peptoniphilus equinus]